MVDAARIMAAERKVQSALNASVRSALAGYDTGLMGDYGIFGLETTSNKENIKNTFMKYLEANIERKNENFKLLNYVIVPESTDIESFGSLLDNGCFKTQIAEYMKYRVPFTITGRLVEKIKTSGLLRKLEISCNEKKSRAGRKELINRISTVNKKINTINGYEQNKVMKYSKDGNEDLTGLKSLRFEMENLSKSIDDIIVFIESYDKEASKQAVSGAEGEISGPVSEFDSAAADCRYAKETIKRNIEKLDKAPVVFEKTKEIILKEPENTEKEPDNRDIKGKTVDFLNRLIDDYEKYGKDIDPGWLISTGDIEGAAAEDEEKYGEMKLNSMNQNINIDEAEVKNDSIIAFMKNLLDSLDEADMHGMEKIYINEYVMDRFTYVTSKTGRGHYLEKGEVEYILGGNENQAANIASVAAKIAFMRFAINSTDYFAVSVNQHPVFRLVNSIGKGFIQSCRDVYELYNGKQVSICPSLESKQASFKLDYPDHLRILLLLQPEYRTLKHMKQLIQVNMKQANPDFRLSNCNTVLHGKAVVKVNLWFLPLLKLDKLRIKNFDGGKYVIDKETYIGY